MLKVNIRDTGNTWERFNELSITHNGKEIAKYRDHGEPEDNSFHRDYSWVAGMLVRAYRLGVEDGKKGKA